MGTSAQQASHSSTALLFLVKDLAAVRTKVEPNDGFNDHMRWLRTLCSSVLYVATTSM